MLMEKLDNKLPTKPLTAVLLFPCDPFSVQDVEGGNVMDTCKPSTINPKAKPGQPTVVCSPGEQLYVSLNEVVKLQCPEASKLASLHWERPNSRLSQDLYLQLGNGSLQFLATPATLGHYMCVSVENGFKQTLAIYSVKQRNSGTTTQAVSSTRVPNRPTADTGRGAGSKTKMTAPTTVSKGMGATTPRVTRNLTSVNQPRLTEARQSMDSNSYFEELVVVSILLALTLCLLVLGAVFTLRQRCRGRTAPQVCPKNDSETGSLQEQDPLTGTAKQNGAVPNGLVRNGLAHGKSPSLKNSSPRASNGYLPNTPM
ncbi:hypothetical protein MATL_G00232540 [Megalops atlanticus]|uniref:Ig-like domain-containing protein n=1 Tax=Megalops atlanticus TaxID=7932 RepID=A0A9D3PFJ0_MEGAT|nr:hypothetical protein MATL_G00232540 [Megalops atlanticus]